MRLIAAPILAFAVTAVSFYAQSQLSSFDRAAAFRAAGFRQVGGQWRSCDAPKGSVYEPGKIEAVSDLNGDGLPEAVVTEGSSFCYGGDEVAFSIVSKQANSSWRRITSSEGIANILETKGAGGWPDIEVAGQGFCFPVQRWNGSEYRTVRFQFEGKPCRLPR